MIILELGQPKTINPSNEKIAKANIGIGIIRRLYCYLPRSALRQIHKSFIRPNHKAAYDDFTREYTLERAFPDPVNINDHFTNKIEAVQYNSALDITGSIRATSRETCTVSYG